MVKIGASCVRIFTQFIPPWRNEGFLFGKMEENRMKNIWQLGLTSILAVFLLAACGGTATDR